MQPVALTVFLILFFAVTVVGFLAARWRHGNLQLLSEWGLAGRRFGTMVTWFLIGGDIYTAYTFIAVPALVYSSGPIGFFALPYTVLVFPIVFVVMPRLWSVSQRHNYITPADFVRGRYGSRGLALAVALTGILATMPYIALQLVGIQVVLAVMGIRSEIALVIAFAILAAYTYSSGLRAPALIAVAKDALIWITVVAAVVVIPSKLGGWGHIFAAAKHHFAHAATPTALVLSPAQGSAYATLALGSALFLFMYPHAITGVLSSNGRGVIRRNAALLPAYSLLLGFIALLGYMAIAAGIKTGKATSMAVPLLFLKEFPSWFAGVAFAAIAIGALVPAAIMSIAAANLFTRNIYREFLRPGVSDHEEARVAKIASLFVKLGALAFVLLLPQVDAINFQLLGGVWILQTFPAIVLGLYSRRLHRFGVLAGWAAGMISGTLMALAEHMKSSIYPVHLGALVVPTYAAVAALVVNLAVTVVASALLNAARVGLSKDETRPEDYDTPVTASPQPGLVH